MLGKIYLFDNKLNKTIKSYSDKELYEEENQEIRIQIRDKFLDKYKDRFKLVCSCNTSIELSIDSLGRVYHKNKSDIEKHDKFCKRNKHYKDNIYKGWETNNKDIIVTLNFNVLPNNTIDKNKQKKLKNKSINLKEFTKRLNIEASQKNIENKFDMLNQIYFISKNIHIKGFKDTSLQDFYFNAKDFKKINSNTPKFVYIYVSDINELDEEYIQIKCEYSKERYFSFVAQKELFHKEYLSKHIKNSKNPIVISGFIHKTQRGLEFYHLSLIRVNYNGIY